MLLYTEALKMCYKEVRTFVNPTSILQYVGNIGYACSAVTSKMLWIHPSAPWRALSISPPYMIGDLAV
jgi:hypothetical protein